MSDNRTNKEFVNDTFFGFSPTGPMTEMFLLDAVTKYAESVVDDKDALIAEMADGFISGEAWVKTAEYILEKFNEKYGKELLS